MDTSLIKTIISHGNEQNVASQRCPINSFANHQSNSFMSRYV